ncbi:DIS3-like exonuclease 2 [Typha latifolia]|uniref:DIS3-like exonuclease 2 n=1 Tax=Typha latifolia TaxID=4733 RepID=UPI003C2FCFF5
MEPVADYAVAAEEEVDKEKKRRRRQNRRPKQNGPAVQGGFSGSMDSVLGQRSELSENCSGGLGGVGRKFVPPKATNVAFSSLPTIHVNGDGNAGATSEIFQSCSLATSSSLAGVPDLIYSSKSAKKYFSPHWSEQDVEEAVKKGNAFKAKFRVNAHNRLEAYCTIDGLPMDVLISGPSAQNRAIEGDIVAVMLDPVAYWNKMKGPNVPSNPVSSDDSYNNFSRKQHSSICGEQSKNCCNGLLQLERGHRYHEKGTFNEAVHYDSESDPVTSTNRENGHGTIPQCSRETEAFEQGEAARALERIRTMINSHPFKRPTGKVLSIMKMSSCRDVVVGFLAFKFSEGEGEGKQINELSSKRNKNVTSLSDADCIHLMPTNSKFPKMVVSVRSLHESLKERLKNGDITVEKELVAARVIDWSEESPFPQAHVLHILGKGGEIDTHIDAILFENAICTASFSPESLACLPDVSWKIPIEEFKTRKDLRDILTFTIDPSSATDLDDALSVEILSDETFRIGVHIADVSYFVRPDTALDTEAQIRSTSVYILRRKLPMLPPELSEAACSLIPGVDRLAFSIVWDIDHHGSIISRWIGRSIIFSCCKLSYDLVQDIIDVDFDQASPTDRSSSQLYGQFEWKDIVKSLRSLYEISKSLKEMRSKDGALSLQNPKLVFLFDECGAPHDSCFDERKESCSLVEEFMLLANRSVAEVISRAFPDCAFLRRHPEPNLRKLREFEAFCCKHGFELDASSSGQLHLSLSKIRKKLKYDPVLFDILISYASKPMQSASYFCSGDLSGKKDEWAHYSLSVPLYTHFTSPLRRYPDIIVHRTLCAALEAEQIYWKKSKNLLQENKGESDGCNITGSCFTGLNFDKAAAESKEGREALAASALKFMVPKCEVLGEVATYCNEKKFSSSHAEEAVEKLYLWALLKRKEVLVSEARVLGLGPRFMSVYVQKFAIERRIYYDEVGGLVVDWLETTNTLVLDIHRSKCFQRRSPMKYRTVEDVALVLNPSEEVLCEEDNKPEATEEEYCAAKLTPLGQPDKDHTAVFPLVLRHLSSIPVALHAIGGDDGPLDIGIRLYMSSYFK